MHSQARVLSEEFENDQRDSASPRQLLKNSFLWKGEAGEDAVKSEV